jgi:hypothetical protein
MKKKTKNTIMALTGAGALASFVVGVAPQVKASRTEPDSTNAYVGGDALSGLKDVTAKDNKKGKKVKKPKKVKSPKKFKA